MGLHVVMCNILTNGFVRFSFSLLKIYSARKTGFNMQQGDDVDCHCVRTLVSYQVSGFVNMHVRGFVARVIAAQYYVLHGCKHCWTME